MNHGMVVWLKTRNLDREKKDEFPSKDKSHFEILKSIFFVHEMYSQFGARWILKVPPI